MMNQQQMGYGAPPEMMMGANNKVAGWNNFDSGIQTRIPSNAPSVMSGASSMHGELHHQYGDMSAYDRLPDMEAQMNAHLEATRADRVRAAMFPETADGGAQSHMAPFERARASNVQALAEPAQLLKTSLASLINYQDNAELAVRAIPELIKLLADRDEVVVTKAALMVNQLANQDPSRGVVASHEQLVGALVQALAVTHNTDIERHATGALFGISRLPQGLHAIFRTNGIRALVQMLKSQVQAVVYYAITTLHNLLMYQDGAKEAVREADGVGVMVCLMDKHCPDSPPDAKFLAILVDCIQLLANNNQPTKIEILANRGPEKIVEIVRTHEYEKLLYMAARLLKILSVCPQNKPAIVHAGGMQALQRHLSHLSQRLVLNALLVLRNLSDAATQEENMEELLLSVVQLLGTSDVSLVTACVGVLANLTCNNERNKQTLCLNYGMESLVRTIDAHKDNVDISEPALCALRHLTARHPLAENAQNHFRGVANASGFLVVVGQLATMRPPVVKAALGLLANLANQTENLLSLREVSVGLGNATQRNHVDITVEVLTNAWFSIREAQSRGHETVPTIDNVSMFELVESATLALHKFAVDPNARGLILASPQPLIPVFVHLLSLEHDNVQRSAGGVLKELSDDADGLLLIQREDPTAILTDLLHSPNRSTAAYASALLQKLSAAKPPALREAIGAEVSTAMFRDESAAWQQDGMGEMPSEPFAELMYQQAQAYDPSANMDQLHVGSPAGGVLWNGADPMDMYGPSPPQHVPHAPPPPHAQPMAAPGWHDTDL